MDEFLHHATSVLLAIPTWIAPLIFLPIARAWLDKSGSPGLWRSWRLSVLGFAAFAAVAWFISPDNSGWPLASVIGEIVLTAPALAAVALILQETRATALPPRRRMTIAGVVGMGALLLCFMPPALISSLLGGGQIGGGCYPASHAVFGAIGG